MLLGYFNLRYQSQTREVRCAHRECDSTESYFADYPASSKNIRGTLPDLGDHRVFLGRYAFFHVLRPTAP